LVSLSSLVYYLQPMLEPIRVEYLEGHHTNGKFLALPANIRLGWKGLPGTNTLAYHDTATIMTVKSFIGQAPGRL
jgi:hypothetical protein